MPLIQLDKENAFIFQESEFEDEQFHPAAFVAKYRKVVSLEMLKEQLRLYSDDLKQQLYKIINNDYKDFINIATNLEGVDTRVDLLRKPIIDLRLDLSGLHDGLISTMQAIEEKLSERTKVTKRKKALESFLSCLGKLDSAEAVLSDEKDAVSVEGSSVKDMPRSFGNVNSKSRRRQLLKYLSRSQSTGLREEFTCSELERAAFTLADVKKAIADLASGLAEPLSGSTSVSGGSTGNIGNSKNTSLNNIVKSLEFRASSLSEQLAARLRTKLETIFTTSVNNFTNEGDSNISAKLSKLIDDVDTLGTTKSNTSSANGASDSTGSTRIFPQRLFLHCSRALVALGRSREVERTLAESVVAPLARSALTPGRVDAGGPRGSYASLEACLLGITDTLRASLLPAFELCELELVKSSATSRAGCVDLIVNAVWSSVGNLLTERFGDMFTIGIADTMARCFHAVEAFTKALMSLAGVDTRLAKSLASRLASDLSVKEFHSRWKLDLYYQLRSQEIAYRLEKACETSRVHGISTDAVLAFDSSPDNSKQQQAGSSNSLDAAATSSSAADSNRSSSIDKLGLSSTLNDADLKELQRTACCNEWIVSPGNVVSFQLPIFRVFLTEAATALHPKVMFQSMAGRFLTLALRVLKRLEAHISLVAEVPTTSFPRGVSVVLASSSLPSSSSMAQLQLNSQPQTDSSSSGPSSGTPQKPATASSLTPQTSGTTAGGGLIVSSLSVSLDDLVALASDCEKVTAWVSGPMNAFVFASLGSHLPLPSNDNTSVGPENGSSRSSSTVSTAKSNNTAESTDFIPVASVVSTCFADEAAALHVLARTVWTRTCTTLVAECTKALSGVRAVAGKYRMTNKPAPDTHSAYVETILQPMRSFLARHKEVIALRFPRGTAIASLLTQPPPGVHSNSTSGDASKSTLKPWDEDVVLDICTSFLAQVQSLLETVRSMDTALQRRAKLRATAATAANTSTVASAISATAITLSDSDKIVLQLQFDTAAFGEEIRTLGFDPMLMKPYQMLLSEVK